MGSVREVKGAEFGEGCVGTGELCNICLLIFVIF